MRFTVQIQKNGHTRSFPCRTPRAVTNLVTDMLNRDAEITIRPFVSNVPAVIETRRAA